MNDGDDALILSSVALEDLHLTEMTLVEASGHQRLLLSQVCVDTSPGIFCYILMCILLPSGCMLPSGVCFATFLGVLCHLLVVCYLLRYVLLHSELCYPTFWLYATF